MENTYPSWAGNPAEYAERHNVIRPEKLAEKCRMGCKLEVDSRLAPRAQISKASDSGPAETHERKWHRGPGAD